MTPINDETSADYPGPHSSTGMKTHDQRRRRRKVLMILGAGTAGLVVLVGCAAGVLTHQANTVRSALEEAAGLVPQLRSELKDSDSQDAAVTFDRMQEKITLARDTATGPLWKAAAAVPFVGANFHAVTEVAVSADDVASRAVAPLLNEYDSLDWAALSPKDGRVDVTQLQEAAPSISASSNTVRLSYERMASIDLSNLIPQVAEPVRSATDQLHTASTALQSVSSAAQLLPPMLGAEGPRNYLVLVQNSAEVRATGGIPGALAMISTNDGRVSLGQQDSAGGIGAFRPALAVDPQQEQIYTSRLGTQMQNVNLTPDFPTAASTAKAMWESKHPGEPIDTVLAIDPLVLANLLAATGPVELENEELLGLINDTDLPTSLTQENVVRTLLSDVYAEINEPELQDLYFASVAQQVFSAFTSGAADAPDLIDALMNSAAENRLRVWSSQRDEQEVIATTSLAGLTTGPTVGGATFGMYFNDGTGAKMDYHMRRQSQLIQRCDGNGYSQITVRVTIENTAPVDAATSLPAYVTGGGVYGIEPGRVRTNYVAYGPAQSLAETATVNGKPVPIASYRHGQRPVGVVSVELGPGETASLEMTFSRVVQTSEPTLQTTPALQPMSESVLPVIRDESCG